MERGRLDWTHEPPVVATSVQTGSVPQRPPVVSWLGYPALDYAPIAASRADPPCPS